MSKRIIGILICALLVGCSTSGSNKSEEISLLPLLADNSFATLQILRPANCRCNELELQVNLDELDPAITNTSDAKSVKEDLILEPLMRSAEAVSYGHSARFKGEKIKTACRNVEDFQLGSVNRCLTTSKSGSLRWICYSDRCSIQD